MPIDPSKFSSALSADTTKSPRELYDLLTNKCPRYKYPRDVQTEVFDKWSELRESADAIFKMNTGSGKTLVGLLILKVCLNEGVTPAVYVAPSKHLAARVIEEASDLTLETTDDPDSPRVISGKAILVISVDRLINGRSVFGVDRIKIKIGTLLVDDAHACVAAAEEKFTLTAGGAVFTELLALFRSDLEKQSTRGYLDIEAADPRQLMLVPFWAWIDRQKDVLSILRKHATEKDVEWSLPLLQDHLQLCRCVFGAGKVEISPRCLPISVIPSFGTAKRRIYMSATFRDDSVLVTHFDAKPGPLKEAITPKTGGDIGDRLILVPQEANPKLADEDLRGLFAEVSKTRNVVVLVASRFRAQFWSSVAKKTLDATNLIEGIESLKAGHVGLVVLINKYDGIDLPGEACQVLVVDGLPDVRRMVEKVDQGALLESEMLLSQSIQRIEQGMGRGIRSKEDYCAVFLMGRTLISHLYAQDALRFFTPATRAQIKFSREASSQLEKGTIKDFSDAIDLFLGRNAIWVQKGRAAVVGAEYNNALTLTPTALNQRAAFNAASIGNFVLAATEMQNAINGEKDPRVRAWLKVELAEYQHRVNASEAQLTLKAAVAANNQLTRPLDGIQYIKMGSLTADQASRTITYLRETYPDPNRLVIDVNGLTDTLVFAPETASEFQRAMARVPFLIGLKGQQPEAETGRGPDDLWNLGETRFAVIECKNGATSEQPINKHDCNQLTGSMEWFREMYGDLCSATPILVHPHRSFEHAATPYEGVRIMNAEKLADFCVALRGFAVGVAGLPNYGTAEQVGRLLQTHSLVSGSLMQRFTTTAQK